MSGYRITYNWFAQWLHILSDWRTQIFSTIQVGNLSWLVCDSTNSGTIKYIPNCFQWCDGSNWITLWWTCIWLPARCGDGTITTPEQCDDSNTNNGDWCSSTCQREVPTCNFTFTPTSWTTPLQVTFSWSSTGRALYTLIFGNWYSVYDLSSFSGQQYTYQSVGSFIPTLLVKNKYNLSIQTGCYAGWTTTSITVNHYCWNWIVENWEQCDGADWCSLSCQRATPPACTFTLTPTSWTLPLQVTFWWSSTGRVVYTLNFDNGYGINNQSSFSWVSTIYTIAWSYHPTLVAKNKYNLDLTTTCTAEWTTTIDATRESKYCGDWIVQSPNDSGNYEECDLWSSNSLTGKCGIACTYNTPDCSIFASPSIFTWWNWAAKLTWQISPRANYTIKTTLPDGSETTQQYSEFKLQTGFEINNQYDMTGEYIITLASNDWVWISCSTNVNVYENWEYACGKIHKSDETSISNLDQWLCAQWYTAINFSGHSSTIVDVWPWKGRTHAALLWNSLSTESPFPYTMVDSGKNMVMYNSGLYIKFLRNLMSLQLTILLPEQWYWYRTRDCEKNDKIIASSCYAHKKINWACAYDMDVRSNTFWISARRFTPDQIAAANENSGYLLKCYLSDQASVDTYPEDKYTRWLPATSPRGNAACQVIPNGNTEWNLYYLHRVCPWYNYWETSQSCDSIVQVGQWIEWCSGLLADFYTVPWSNLNVVNTKP